MKKEDIIKDYEKFLKDMVIENFLEELEESCFPIQINWNNKEIYIKGIKNALKNCNFEIIEKKENERNAGRKKKLDDETIEQIKYERRVYGSKITDLADKYQVSTGLIHKITSN